ncbi:MAG: DUF1501 domain-containing protein [Acidobacteria bacterium]|nr:DUF1501 domain-containing protein [Acidobacteriota bacterium]
MNRRDAIKLGGLALTAAAMGETLRPLKVKAASKANPRGTARNCIVIEMGGAISQADCWDFKETRYTPKDLDIQKFSSDIWLSKTLFPRAAEYIEKIALVRSMRANEMIHFIGQYHTQTGRALNVAIAREIPAFGSIIAYELASRRRDSDTFPAYVSTYLTGSANRAIGCGFLPTSTTGLDLDPTTAFDAFSGETAATGETMNRRWNLLRDFQKISGGDRSAMGKGATDYTAFYEEAERIAGDPRWAAVFKTTPEERERYGNDEYGLGLILAKNLLKADAGTHFIYVYDGNRWDQHSYIFDRTKRLNHYANCERFDKGFASLVNDLSSLPGSAAGKTMFDETLMVCTSEFGRTPAMNAVEGRDHYRQCYTALFAGAGVKGGRAIGRTNHDASECIETGWNHKEQPFMDNTAATIYSALGIDWMKSIENTPSGRAYEYVQTAPVGGGEFISNDEIAPLFE